MVKLVITENEGNQRLDRFLRKYLKQAPLAMIYKLIRRDVKINGKRGKEDTILHAGDELTLYLPEEKLAELTRPKKGHRARISFGVVYEDENVLVVNKPSGLLTHGDAHEKKNTLVNQVCGYLQDKGEYDPAGERTFAPAPANRLDRNTSGIVVFGKNAESLRQLTRLISEKEQTGKIYRAMVCGHLDKELVLEDHLVKDEASNTVRVTTADTGKTAQTFAKPVRAGRRLSDVQIRLVTGRTHQIRVHLATAGYPVAGDAKYGNTKTNAWLRKELGITTQVLHAYRLELGQIEGPLAYLSGRSFEAPLPEDFRRLSEVMD